MTMLSDEQINNCSKEELVDVVKMLQTEYQIIKERLKTLEANMFGRKTEKLLPVNVDQMNIFNEFECVEDGTEYDDGKPADESEPEPEPEAETEESTNSRKKNKGKRQSDLKGLPKVIVNHEIPEEELIAKYGENGWKRLPDQVYSKLQIEPAKYTVIEHHIAVYAGKNTDDVVKAEHPVELINNSIATESLVAAIINAKFANAMPLYRIEKEIENYGVAISRQNMAHWAILCSERYLSLLYERMHELLQKEHVIQTDETPAYVSKRPEDSAKKSEMWVYRTGEYNTEKPIVLFKYAAGRKADYAIDFLKDFEGYLECDSYGGYHKIDRISDKISICCCWAHARRRFADAVKAYGQKQAGVQNTLAYKALEKIALIYHADEKLKNLSPEERQKRRQTAVKRRVDEFFAWAKEHKYDTGKKDKTWEGFSYCLNNENFLRRFLEDGEIPIDNSATERAIRPFTVSRKTWKLIDTVRGADSSATMYSIVETAKANHIKVYDYLKLLLEEIPKHMDDKNLDFIDELLPWSDTVKEKCQKNKKK